MMEKKISVLIVEDNPADAELLELELLKGGFTPRILRVETAPAMQAALEADDFDLILSDYRMPRFTGLHALELLKASGKDIPFILISGSAGEEVAVNAMKAGAHDFFTKGRVALLLSAIERELREAELRSIAREQLEQLHRNEKLAALGTLLAGVAHELNNPLTVIMHQAALLQRVLKDDPRQLRADTIMEAVGRCSRIIRNFLALARHEPPRRMSVSINDVVREVMELVAYGLRVDGVDVELDLVEPLPRVSADPQQLQQLVINLVNNAQYALHSRTGARRLILRSEVDASGSGVVLQVKDNAGGIPAEIRSRIFDPFFTTKPIGQGTGLGLSLCHGIVSAHKGTIELSSETEGGTTFVITLPVESVAGAQSETGDTGARPLVPAQRILVVDDEPDVASAFSDILSAQGHRVDVAAGGRTALQLLDHGTYDIVMTDMRMPELDGPSLYRDIVARHPLLESSFIFVTGDTFNPETDRFLRHTGAVRLSKPCSFDDIEEAIQLVLQKRTEEHPGGAMEASEPMSSNAQSL
jgi:signal transduction histidine kinase